MNKGLAKLFANINDQTSMFTHLERTPEKKFSKTKKSSEEESSKEFDDALSTVKLLQKRLRTHDKDLLLEEIHQKKALKLDSDDNSRGSLIKEFTSIEEESTAANSNSVHSLGSIPTNEDSASRRSNFSKFVATEVSSSFPFTSFKNLKNNMSLDPSSASSQKISSLIGSPLSIFKNEIRGPLAANLSAKKSPRTHAYSPRSPFRFLDNLIKTPKKSSPASGGKRAEIEAKAAAIMRKTPLKARYRKLFDEQPQEMDLEEEEKKVVLPVEYSHLKRIFEQLDLLITYLNNRRLAATFETITETLERNHKLRFTYRHLSKILYVYPECFKLDWDKNPANKSNTELFMSFGEEKPISERLKSFENRLKMLTRKHHIQFLETLSDEDASKKQFLDRNGEAPYHPLFNVDKTPEIPSPLELIPEKPYNEKVQTIKEHLLRRGPFSTETNKTLAEVLEKSSKQLETPVLDINELSKQCSTKIARSVSLGLSDDLIKKMKEKEIANSKKKELELKKAGTNLKSKQKLKKVAEIVKMHFDMRNCSNMFWANVVDHVNTVNSSLIIGKVEISEILEALIKVCPLWMKSVINKEGRIIRIDKMLPINVVMKTIDDNEAL